MSTETLPLDPEVLALVEEVLDDPNAGLLRKAPRSALRGIERLTEPVSANATELSKVERHLVKAYREELARLLLNRARRLRFLHPLASTRIYREAATERLRTILDDKEERSRTNAILGSTRSLQAVDKGFLGGCRYLTEAEEDKTRGCLDLILASLRLVPSLEARFSLAVQCILEEDRATADRLVGLVLQGPVPDLMRSCALECKADSFLERGQFEEVLDCLRLSTETSEQRPPAAAKWLIAACYVEREEEVRQAGALLDSIANARHPSLIECVRMNKEQIRAGNWKPTRKSREITRRLSDSFGSASREVIRVFEMV